MMRRAKDDTRSRASGPGETPQKTGIFLERSKTVQIGLSVNESSNTQIFASATIPQKFKFLISDRMLLLFLAQAILSACGGGGGGGGNKPGPVLKGSPAPLPAKTESTPPEPATKPVVKGNPAPLPAKTESSPPEPVTEPELKGKPAPLPAKTESSPPEPAPEPVSVSPPVSSPKPLSVESPSSIVNHSNRPVVQLVQQFEEELPSESDDDAAEQP
jgi:hypothetical protein